MSKKPLIEVKVNTPDEQQPRKLGEKELQRMIVEEMLKFKTDFVNSTFSDVISEGVEGKPAKRLTLGELKAIIKEELQRSKDNGWEFPLPLHPVRKVSPKAKGKKKA